MKGQASASRSANASSTATGDGSGSNRNPAPDQASTSASRIEQENGARILIVEDNAGDITLLRAALKAKGLDRAVSVIRDGESAMKFADAIDLDPDTICPSLVILDLNLPRVSGKEILKRYRASGRMGAVPIVVFSSSTDERDRLAVMDLGASSYLHKPLDLEEFMRIGDRVEALLMMDHADEGDRPNGNATGGAT